MINIGENLKQLSKTQEKSFLASAEAFFRIFLALLFQFFHTDEKTKLFKSFFLSLFCSTQNNPLQILFWH